jgi:hypothetical protein
MRNDLPKMARQIREVEKFLFGEFLDKHFLARALELKGRYQNNIFRDGKNGNDSKIGSYSTKPISVSVNQFPRKSYTTANGKRKRAGKRKSVYFKGGYKAFRAAVGRQNKFVDLNLSGSLFASVIIIKQTRKYLAVGIRDTNELKKLGGMIKKYGKITFRVPKRLISEMKKGLEKDISAAVKKIINAK